MAINEPFQPRVSYENVDDALHDLVMFLGGYKKVAPMLWPPEPDGKSLEEAAQLLRHCLNKNRREKLSPQQMLFLLRKGNETGFHGAKHFIDEDTGYEKSRPLSPKDEMADIQRRQEALMSEMRALLERQERLSRPPLQAVSK